MFEAINEFFIQAYDVVVNFILPLIVVLGILVFVHELGHFLAAKFFGVRVERFSIGFPPRIFGVQVGETDYCISAVPLGGYVKMSGMIDESLDDRLTGADYEFMSKPTYQKIIIICAGVVMNFVLAVVLLAGQLYIQGEPQTPLTPIDHVEANTLADTLGFEIGDQLFRANSAPIVHLEDIHDVLNNHIGDDLVLTVDRVDGTQADIAIPWDVIKTRGLRIGFSIPVPAKIGSFAEGMPAESSGMQIGDRIIAIGDSVINGWQDMTSIVSVSAGVPLDFLVERGPDTLAFTITPALIEDEWNGEPLDSSMHNIGVIGIARFTQYRYVGFQDACVKGFLSAITVGRSNVQGFGLILSGREPLGPNLMGPVRITQHLGRIFKNVGVSGLVMMAAYLSVILAIVNILPIPALDGGHLIIIIIEGIRKKPLPLNLKIRVQQVGFLFLLMLMVFIFFNDIRHF